MADLSKELNKELSKDFAYCEDCISRQAALNALDEQIRQCDKALSAFDISMRDAYAAKVERASLVAFRETLEYMPSAQPEKRTEKRTETHACDLISRKKVRYKLTALVNELEEIFANIRERNEDDSVCGLCEYDGAYIGQSGDWCNECPGFDKSDCFKLKDKYRHEWEAIDE